MTNEELVELYQQGQDVFELLVEQNMGAIDKYAYKFSCCSLLEKDDLVNDFIFTLWKCAKSYDSSKNVSFITLFIRSIKNSFAIMTRTKEYKCRKITISYHTKIKCVDNGEVEMIELIRDKQVGNEFELLKDECRSILDKRVRDRTKDIVLEYLFTDKTYKEVGEKYGITSQGVESRVKAIKKILREELDRY